MSESVLQGCEQDYSPRPGQVSPVMWDRSFTGSRPHDFFLGIVSVYWVNATRVERHALTMRHIQVLNRNQSRSVLVSGSLRRHFRSTWLLTVSEHSSNSVICRYE